MDYAKIIEGLKSLINDNTSPEEAEKIAAISKDVEAAKTEYEDQLIKHEELRGKYIKAIQNSTFKDEPQKQEDDEPKSLEECIGAVIKERKDK